MESRTVPHPVAGIPVRTLLVEVIDGPDRGRSFPAASEIVAIGSATGNDVVLTDPTVSRFHVELTRRAGGIQVRDVGSTNGVLCNGLRLERATVPPGTSLTLGASLVRLGDGETTTVELTAGPAFCGLRGQSPTMRRLFATAQRAAASDATVLFVGESGTGKELLAEAIHGLSRRFAAPFVTVDCGALAPTLIASDLFGHERGAFTGAEARRIGAFEQAHGGTLFLDEIGELPEPLQAHLLGVLERGRFRRVGGKDDIEVDVRVVCATNRDLRAEVNQGNFRLDLYYRIAVLSLTVPPLRERKDDIPALIEHFLRVAGHGGPVSEVFSAKAMETVLRHPWPGNVRELRNFVEAILALGEPAALAMAASSSAMTGAARPTPVAAWDGQLGAQSYKDTRRALVDDFERRYLAALMAQTDGNVSMAARLARMDRSHLTDLLKRYHRGGGE